MEKQAAPDPIRQYLELAEKRPEWFRPAPDGKTLRIDLDESRIRAFQKKTGKAMGLVFDNSPYWIVVRDLVEPGFAYGRVLYPAVSGGGVCIPRRGGKYGLLRIFRHALREECLEFPRGFNEKDLPPEENIRRELEEETGARVTEVVRLGRIRQDSGLCSGEAFAFLAEVSDVRVSVGHEGIRGMVWLDKGELLEKLAAGEIRDGFTLSALMLLTAREGGL